MTKSLARPRRKAFNALMPRKASRPNLRATLNALQLKANGGDCEAAAQLKAYEQARRYVASGRTWLAADAYATTRKTR